MKAAHEESVAFGSADLFGWNYTQRGLRAEGLSAGSIPSSWDNESFIPEGES